MKLQQREKPLFTKKVIGKPFPPKFKMPSLPTFLGKEDPHKHILHAEVIKLVKTKEDNEKKRKEIDSKGAE